MDRSIDIRAKENVMLFVVEKDQGGTGTSAQDGKTGIGEQQS
jgi:hypothetical protein